MAPRWSSGLRFEIGELTLIVPARSFASTCRVMSALAFALAACCCSTPSPRATLVCAAARPASLPAFSASCRIPPPPPSKTPITRRVTQCQYCLASAGIAGHSSRQTWFFMCCSATYTVFDPRPLRAVASACPADCSSARCQLYALNS